MRRASLHSSLLLVVLLGGCAKEEQILFPTLEADCDNECRILTTVCEYEGPPSASEARAFCVEECFEWKDDALAHSDECARSYERMMECVGDLTSCTEVEAWIKRASASNPCSDESAAFDRFCEGFL